MFSAYFVFHYLNMFYVEKQVSEFLATHFGYLPIHETSHKLTQNGFATHSRLISQLANRKTPRNSFLKGLFVGNLF